MPESGGSRSRGWRATRTPAGWPVLFHGWIDNAAELQAGLGLAGCGFAQLYGMAVERWGNRADRSVIGAYAAIVCLPDGTVRLSRSPWASYPLFYYRDDEKFIASSLPRPIFACGVPKRLRMEAVEQMLCMELQGDTETSFENIEQVPHGSILTVGRGRVELDRWYDPLAVEPIRLACDDDYVEAANSLLAQAVDAALRGTARQGMMLSGGLDSPIVCDEVLRQLPPQQSLPSFTFRPLPEWDGKVPAHGFGDDWPHVQEFARSHPGLDPQAVDNRGIGFDDRAEKIHLACDGGHPSRLLGTVYHGVYDAARERGCQWLLNAASGNMTFSSDAPWAAPEFLRRGRFRELWRLLSGKAGKRGVLHRLLAEAVAPNLPLPLYRIYRTVLDLRREEDQFANPLLHREGRLARYRRQGNVRSNYAMAGQGRGRAEAITAMYAAMGTGGEIGLGYEQVFGIRQRDVTAYRPLIEFCNAIPTDQFVRNGETRFLARRMARGRLPEAQRMNRLYGQHNVDWHARMTPRLGELREQIDAVARHPEIGPLIDIDRARRLIDHWPETTPDDQQLAGQLRFFLPSVLYVTRYLDFMTGRNQR